MKLGQPATFSSLATGKGLLHYQWRSQGLAVEGAQSATYTLPAATLDQDGSTYQNFVTDDNQTTASGIATLHVSLSLADMAIDGIQLTLPDGPALLTPVAPLWTAASNE